MRFFPVLSVTISIAISALIVSCSNGGSSSSGGSNGGNNNVTRVNCPSARSATGSGDLVQGPLARGRVGDYVLENKVIRTIIQKPGRNWFSIAQFGGNIIDAVPKTANGDLAAEDHYEEAALGTNIESSPNYQTIEILQAGGRDASGNCQAAVIRATGPDDLLDFVNGSSAIRDLGFMFPDSADDIDLPATISTVYTLEPGAKAVKIDTHVINDSSSDFDMYLVEYLNGSGEVEFFQYGYGFGEPLITAPCDECRFGIYAGHEGGSGVSYGVLHDFATTTSLSVSGVSVLVYGTDALLLAAAGDTLAPAPFTIPAGGEQVFTRHFAVGTGDVGSVLDIHYALRGETVGSVSGIVTDTNGPIAGAEIAVITTVSNFEPALIPNADNIPLLQDLPGIMDVPIGSLLIPRGPETIVANHFRTDANGRYQGTLPVGDYELRINVPGRATPSPATANVSVTTDALAVQDFSVPEPARLRVFVSDENGDPVAAKVQLIGSEDSPDANEPLNGETIFQGPLSPILSQVANLGVSTGIFGDPGADPLPNGIVLTEFAVDGQHGDIPVNVGDTGILEVEPGSYVLSVSRGNRYSQFTRNVTLTEGQLTNVDALVVRVVDTPDQLFGDFHVHSFNSPDSEVTDRERVATYISEDVDFFTPSDHGMRRDFLPVVNAMGLNDVIAVAPSSENTTFDYGHFNAWPVLIDETPASTDEPSQSNDPKTSAGSIDWGSPTPPGEDFPGLGNYSLTPAEIYADAKSEPYTPGETVVVQINHVETHFGPLGLAIDTGVSPPQSGKAPADRRLDPAESNLYDETHGYDTLELLIGADGLEQFEFFPNDNLGDWFNLLNQDIVKTFVSNSDTHTRRVTSLSTRNLIPIPENLKSGDRPDYRAISQNPHAIGDFVRAGRSIGTNSLWMDVSAENAASQTAGLGLEHSFGLRSTPLPITSAEDVTLKLKIRSPLWAEYDRISVYLNTPTQPFTTDDAPRYRPCSDQINLTLGNGDFARNQVTAVQVANVDFQRFETDLDISIPNPGKDFWLVVFVEGTPGVSKPLWPVVADDFTNNDADPTTASAEDRGLPAFAMSNPIFFDHNADGYQAPGLSFCEAEESGGDPLGLGLPLPALPVP